MAATRIKHGTLTAATVATVTLPLTYANVEVCNRGTAEIFFTVDGSTPTVGGDDTWVVPASSALSVPNPVPAEPALSVAPGVTVKLISSSTPAYSVTGQ